MRKFIAPILATVAILLATAAPAAAVTLARPDGTPIGGQFQKWANQSKVATYSGTVILSPAMPLCVNPAVYGCATGALYPSSAYGTRFAVGVRTGVDQQVERSVLLSELAHIFDWAYLDGWAHYGFAMLWKVNPTTSWLDSPAGLQAGIEDGLEGSFQVAYVACANGNTTAGRMRWGTGPNIPAIAFGPTTCAAINWIASLHSATMPYARATAAARAAVWAAAASESMAARIAFSRSR